MHDEQSATPPAAAEVLELLTTLAAEDAEAFLEEVAGQPDLIDNIVRVATADGLWLETALGALRRVGISVKSRDRFAAMIKPRIREAQKANRADRPHLHEVDPNAGPPTVKSVLPTAPVSDDAVIPAGYDLKLNGITVIVEGKEGVERRRIADGPILITGRHVHTTDTSELVRITYLRDGHWASVTVPRDVAMNHRKLIDTTRHGLPIHSGGAGATSRYLSEYETANLAVIPTTRVSQHLGWQEGTSEPTFLFGRRQLRADTQDEGEIDIEAIPPLDWKEDWISFSGADGGDHQLVRAYQPQGTFEGWQEAISVIQPYPKVQLALYAAFAAPLLEVLGASSFLVDWCGETSKGKSITLMVAASVDGNPDPVAPHSVMGTWNSTKVFIERRAALLNGLSVCLDDSKQARRKEDVAETIYLIAGGQGRGRGSPQGIRQTGSWRVVLLSTGEMPAVSHTNAGGTRARSLTMWGIPFETATPKTAILVNTLAERLKRHHGHAGPRFVQFLLSNQHEWDKWRTVYHKEVDRLIAESAGNSVAGRLASSFAVIRTAAELAHLADLIPWDSSDAITELWGVLVDEARGADRAADALRDVFGWTASRENQFFGRLDRDHEGNFRIPSSGALGAWKQMNWEWIGFTRPALRGFLEQQGYDVEGVIRTWADRGWIDLGIDHGAPSVTKAFRMGNQAVRGYIVTRDAFEEVGASGAQETVE